MQRRGDTTEPDLFDSFADTVGDDEGPEGLPAAGTLARSAGVTLTLMVLTSLGAIAAAWVASSRPPDIAWTSLLWEGVVLLLWSGLWGLLGGAAALSLGVVAVALPWVRRQRGRG